MKRRHFLAGMGAAGLLAQPAPSAFGAAANDLPAALVDGAGQDGMTLRVQPLRAPLKVGHIITISGVRAFNRSAMAPTTSLREFVVTANVAEGRSLIPIYPAIISTGRYTTVVDLPVEGAPVRILKQPLPWFAT